MRGALCAAKNDVRIHRNNIAGTNDKARNTYIDFRSSLKHSCLFAKPTLALTALDYTDKEIRSIFMFLLSQERPTVSKDLADASLVQPVFVELILFNFHVLCQNFVETHSQVMRSKLLRKWQHSQNYSTVRITEHLSRYRVAGSSKEMKTKSRKENTKVWSILIQPLVCENSQT